MSDQNHRTQPADPPPSADMVWIPGGTFQMGSEVHYPEERPVHRVTRRRVLDRSRRRSPTSRSRASLRKHGTSTFAEMPPESRRITPARKTELLHPGSLVFMKPPHPVDLRDFRNWWKFILGADWRHPHGPRLDSQRP